MGASLLGVFGLLALALASVGLYGVIAFSVARRDREIGVRVAMGARPGDVLRLVLRGGMALVAAGIVAGLAAAAGLSRFLSGVLYGTSSVDPVAYGAAAAALLAVAFAANYLPARRAARLDPLAALRQE
jgi:ABC-type antimicrobial peptide transport system permease subunit